MTHALRKWCMWISSNEAKSCRLKLYKRDSFFIHLSSKPLHDAGELPLSSSGWQYLDQMGNVREPRDLALGVMNWNILNLRWALRFYSNRFSNKISRIMFFHVGPRAQDSRED